MCFCSGKKKRGWKIKCSKMEHFGAIGAKMEQMEHQKWILLPRIQVRDIHSEVGKCVFDWLCQGQCVSCSNRGPEQIGKGFIASLSLAAKSPLRCRKWNRSFHSSQTQSPVLSQATVSHCQKGVYPFLFFTLVKNLDLSNKALKLDTSAKRKVIPGLFTVYDEQFYKTAWWSN